MAQPFRFASPTDQVVCAFCSRHVGGDKAEKRDADHVAMWAERYGEAVEEHRLFVAEATAERLADDAVIAQLRARVGELTRSIADSFEGSDLGGAHSLVETEVIRRAERKTELAQRLNDRIMAALWRVERLHRDADAGGNSCTCGRPTATCAEWRAVEPQRRTLRDWEARNVALLKGGNRHALPEEHPEAREAGASLR
ncbi:hypothetical protein [Lacisediminihabitans sp.]|jgi:hypothetical protein|uniref:hypothetical protein n=1 Tax=Lacisediminihabitans sp. TaxID=2787631 RepID=UPI002F92FC97